MLPVDDGAGLLRHIDALCALARYFKSLSSAGEYRFLPLDYKINSLLLLVKKMTKELVVGRPG